MNTLIIILIAVLPALALMIFIFFQDNHEREPIGLLLKIFLLGILSVLPVLLFEFIADFLLKLIFGGLYLLTNSNSAVTLGIQRGFLAIPAHAMCAIFMGYYYGNAKYQKSYGNRIAGRRNLLIGFLIASSLHAFYDFCLFTNMGIFFLLFAIFVVVADILTIIRIVKARKENEKMYEAPQYRQYWVNSNPYQPYGGYAAPVYGGYSYANASGNANGQVALSHHLPALHQPTHRIALVRMLLKGVPLQAMHLRVPILLQLWLLDSSIILKLFHREPPIRHLLRIRVRLRFLQLRHKEILTFHLLKVRVQLMRHLLKARVQLMRHLLKARVQHMLLTVCSSQMFRHHQNSNPKSSCRPKLLQLYRLFE